jgi:hypothetical protein
MYNLYLEEIGRCIERSNTFYGTPYRVWKGLFVPITSRRYVHRSQLFCRLAWIQTGLMYLALLLVWWKGESKNHLLLSIGIVMYYTSAVNLGLCYKNMDSTWQTTVLINSWIKFQRSLTEFGPSKKGTNILSYKSINKPKYACGFIFLLHSL